MVNEIRVRLVVGYNICVMGCISSDTGSPIQSTIQQARPVGMLTVATLNYCGIMNSPFQFYCDDYLVELKDISKEFVDLIPVYFQGFDKATWKWNMGKLDLKFRNRYSPMFEMRAGVKEDDTFMSQQEFERHWDEVFQKEAPKIKMEYNEQQKEVAKKYDVMMFHTLLRYVFKTVNLKDAEGTSAQPYFKKLSPLYNLSFLDENRKCLKVQQNFSRIDADVFFFQQYAQNFYDAIKATNNFWLSIDQNKDTLIVAKKSSFASEAKSNDIFLQTSVGKDLADRLNWNERTSFLIIEKYIFINAHMSSKSERNKPQLQALRVGVKELRAKLPDFDVVVAGDLNAYLEPFSEDFSFFPLGENDMTTVKKRTFTQGQFNKADKVVRESKDKIISSLKITKGLISYITGNLPSNSNLVPTDEHPFDHFVVVASMEKREN